MMRRQVIFAMRFDGRMTSAALYIREKEKRLMHLIAIDYRAYAAYNEATILPIERHAIYF